MNPYQPGLFSDQEHNPVGGGNFQSTTKPDVIEAGANGKFRVYTGAHFDDGTSADEGSDTIVVSHFEGIVSYDQVKVMAFSQRIPFDEWLRV